VKRRGDTAQGEEKGRRGENETKGGREVQHSRKFGRAPLSATAGKFGSRQSGEGNREHGGGKNFSASARRRHARGGRKRSGGSGFGIASVRTGVWALLVFSRVGFISCDRL
jgi:hypothetical protein